MSLKEFFGITKNKSIILLAVIIFLLVPLPNIYLYQSCLENHFPDGTHDSYCNSHIGINFVNGLMLFINFSSFKIYNRFDYHNISFLYFLIAGSLSVLFSYIITMIYLEKSYYKLMIFGIFLLLN